MRNDTTGYEIVSSLFHTHSLVYTYTEDSAQTGKYSIRLLINAISPLNSYSGQCISIASMSVDITGAQHLLRSSSVVVYILNTLNTTQHTRLCVRERASNSWCTFRMVLYRWIICASIYAFLLLFKNQISFWLDLLSFIDIYNHANILGFTLDKSSKLHTRVYIYLSEWKHTPV